MTPIEQRPSPVVVSTLTGIGVVIGVVVAVLTSDVILGIIAGASFIAVAVGLVRLWVGGGTRRPRHP
jgi:arginine repressor